MNALIVAFVLAFASLATAKEPKALFTWNFETQADVDAWGSNHLEKKESRNGSYYAKYASWDPFIVSPQVNFKPKPGQYVEIRMRSTGYSVGEIFYASSNEGIYNGFSQEKTAAWPIVHDGQWRTYQIMPAWLSEPQIVKIRVDFGRPTEEEIKNGAELEVDYVRIVDIDLENVKQSQKSAWNAEELEGLTLDSSDVTNGWVGEIGEYNPEQIGSNFYFQFERVATNSEPTPFPRAKLRFITGTGSGVVQLEVPLFNLGTNVPNIFEKNVDLSAFDAWGATFYRWELTTPKEYVAKKIAFSKEPLGSGAIETNGNGEQTALARLNDGKAIIQYELLVRNSGGKPLDKFVLSDALGDNSTKLLSVTAQKVAVDPLLGFNPTGDRLASKKIEEGSQAAITSLTVDDSGATRFPDAFKLLPGEALKIVAKYEATKSGSFTKSLKLESNEQSYVFNPKLTVLPEATLPKLDYVAPPQKLESDYEIGAYYFPGWSKRSGWDKIDQAAPIRKPLLGYYDEGNPEVVDWQIKWAAENGIQFFFVDWYWKKGKISLDHWVRAFQRAKYRSSLKWAVMWANHTGPGTHSTEDWKEVTKFWLDNYFNTPEYYTIDGKPVVVIWDHSIVDNDMINEAKEEGLALKPGEGCKRAFEIVRKMCVDAGYPGVYFIAVKWPEHAVDAQTVQKYADAGFDATTIYHFMYPGKNPKDPTLYPFSQVAEASKPNWEEREQTGILPSIPNISTGWDSRPWHGFRNTVVYDRNVESFRRILKDYKEFAEKTGVKRVVLAPLNEWGEGSYIEPNNEFGFGMYEAIREELCKKPKDGFPLNYAPYEVGLGPYDLPKE